MSDHAIEYNEADEPEGCEECAWLAEQGRAALLSGDKSRQVDIRVLQYRHGLAEHAGERSGGSAEAG